MTTLPTDEEVQTIVKRMTPLCDIMNAQGSDKGSGHHNYTRLYHILFQHLCEREMNMLEIGIGSINPSVVSNMAGHYHPGGYKPGASLRGWEEYFQKGQIFGCDIDRDTLFSTDRIRTFHLDQRSKDSVTNALYKDLADVMFDVIIDDGLHVFGVNVDVAIWALNKLNPGGYYVIEDIVDFNQGQYDRLVAHLEVHGMNWPIKYYRIPNPQNNADNNVVIIRRPE